MATQLPFTGERIVPGQTPVYLVWAHTARYRWIRHAVSDKTVLDAGCGEGYGAYYLAQDAKKVVGVDLSPETISHARKAYQKENLAYAVLDCRNLTFADNSFDVVCSFEVIEHLYPVDQFLSEVHRVLKPGGVFYVSTPNGGLNVCAGQNPYHEKEFTLAEYRSELSNLFEDVEVYGQFCTRPVREFLFMQSTRLYLKSNVYRGVLQGLAPFYFRGTRAQSAVGNPNWVETMNSDAFDFGTRNLERSTYFLAVCRKG